MTTSSPTPQIYGTAEHPYSTLPETQEPDLPYADLVNVDLSKFDQPGGKEELARQLRDGVHGTGFFYVTGFGISQERVDKQFAIGKEVFDQDFKTGREPFAADHANGGYNGYTGRQLEHFKKIQAETKVPDNRGNVEVYNIPKFTPHFDDFHTKHGHPDPVVKNWEEIKQFGKDIHTEVVNKLLVLFAIVLELKDENYFVDRHRYEEKSEDHLRYMKYAARPHEVNVAAKGLYTGGHTDLGSVTLLFRQPVLGLQVLAHDGTWHFVKPLKGSITVNVADTLQILSGNYLKSSVHRVVAPQKDQEHLDRIGVLYFVRPNNDVLVKAVEDSPVLSAENAYEAVKDEEYTKKPITVEEWVKAKQAYIFSKAARERYENSLANEGATNKGEERKELEVKVAGIASKVWT